MNQQEQYRSNANRYIKEEPVDLAEEHIDEIVNEAEIIFWKHIQEEVGVSEPMGMDEELLWRNKIHPILVSFVKDFLRNS